MAEEYNMNGNPFEQGMQVGQGEAFVFTPNTKPLDILSGALNNQLAFEEKKLKQKEEQAKLKDAALEKELLELKADVKWDRAVEQIDSKLTELSDELITARIKGKDVSSPLYQRNVDRKKLELQAISNMNLSTYDMYTKLLPELRDRDKYDQTVVDQWIKDFDNLKTIEERYDFITHNRPGEEFDFLKYLRTNMSKEEQSGRTTQTLEDKNRKAVEAAFNNLPEYRKMEMYNEGLKNNWYTDNADGSMNKEAMIKAYDEELKAYYVKDVSPPPMRSGGGGGYQVPQIQLSGTRRYDYGTGDQFVDFLSFGKSGKGLYAGNFYDANGNQVKIIPTGFQYTGTPYGDKPGGWIMEGKLAGQEQKTVVSSEDAAGAFENSDRYEDVNVNSNGDGTYTVTYKELQDYSIPVTIDNYNLLQSQYGFDLNQAAQSENARQKLPQHDYYTIPTKSFGVQGMNMNAEEEDGGGAKSIINRVFKTSF
jgi:hypothetical protein